MFQNVIVRTPCRAMVDGITGSPELGKPNYEKALCQHKAYIEAMEQCGVKVTVTEAAEQFPDSCFVEDVAIVTEKGAVITNPGAASRNREIELIEPVLREFYKGDSIKHITAPGTLDGGDVMMVENHFYVGLSNRTNEEGAKQLIAHLESFGYTGSVMKVKDLLHLKTGMTYIGDNHLIVSKRFADSEALAQFDRLVVDYDEEYCANCINMNGKIIVPAGYPNTLKSIQALGYETICVEMSEFKKIDGGLTCLSLRF
ncbi:MAG: dimethylarginine dimethylaminohydrolase family protein [Oscillospiraceae bacterium]|jgi:dimethylargininase